MKIEAAILNHARLREAVETARRLTDCGIPTRIVSSPNPADDHDADWDVPIDVIDPQSYYGGKFDHAVAATDGDVLGILTCDCTVPDVPLLAARAREVFTGRPQVGIWAPDVAWTYWRFDRQDLRAVDDGLYEVPLTDSTCWFVRREVLARLCPLDVPSPFYGWGIDTVASYLARQQGKLVVRDYTLKVDHPRDRSYDSDAAHRQVAQFYAQHEHSQGVLALRSEGLALVSRYVGRRK
jgi:hypothetical protein